MDCFKSGREGAAPTPAPVVLAGRGGAADSPRKSKPSSESLVLVALGGAGSALGGIWRVEGAAELDLWGGSSPPIRSACGA